MRGLPADLRETRATGAAVEALRTTVDEMHAEAGRDAAGAAWHAGLVGRCSTRPTVAPSPACG